MPLAKEFLNYKKEGAFIKKLTLALVIVIAISMFAGCSKSGKVDPVDTPFAIYSKTGDIVLKIGDKRDDLEPLLGPVARMIVEYEEFSLERVDYWETEDVYLDYTMDGTVVALRFSSKDWQLANGLTVGSKVADVKSNYPEENFFKFEETEDLWVAFDEKGNIVEFSETAPYFIRFKIKGGLVEMIAVKDGSMGNGLF